MASGRRPPRSAGRDLDVVRTCLPREDEDAAEAGPLARPDVGAHVVADHRDVVAASAVVARGDLASQVGDRQREERPATACR